MLRRVENTIDSAGEDVAADARYLGRQIERGARFVRREVGRAIDDVEDAGSDLVRTIRKHVSPEDIIRRFVAAPEGFEEAHGASKLRMHVFWSNLAAFFALAACIGVSVAFSTILTIFNTPNGLASIAMGLSAVACGLAGRMTHLLVLLELRCAFTGLAIALMGLQIPWFIQDTVFCTGQSPAVVQTMMSCITNNTITACSVKPPGGSVAACPNLVYGTVQGNLWFAAEFILASVLIITFSASLIYSLKMVKDDKLIVAQHKKLKHQKFQQMEEMVGMADDAVPQQRAVVGSSLVPAGASGQLYVPAMPATVMQQPQPAVVYARQPVARGAGGGGGGYIVVGNPGQYAQ